MRSPMKRALAEVLLLAAVAIAVLAFAGSGASGGSDAVAAGPPAASVQVINSTASPVPVTGAVKLDSGGNTVRVASSETSPVYVTTADAAAKEPIPFYLHVDIADGVADGSAVATVSEDKWFVVEVASVEGALPQGQSWLDCSLTAGPGRTLSALGLRPSDSAYDPTLQYQRWYLNATPCKLYVAPGAELGWSARRSGVSGSGSLTVLLVGYLTDAP